MVIVYFLIVAESFMMYVYLHHKTRISLKYLYKDNLVVIVLSCVFCSLLFREVTAVSLFFSLASVPLLGFLLTLLRFFRYPMRKIVTDEDAILSSADGNVIYIRRIEKGCVPMSEKNGVTASLDEFLSVPFDTPCLIIGINMTPFDVHRNSAPVSGTVLVNRHTDGSFISLKDPDAVRRNERNTMIIDRGDIKVGVVQTASRLVRRIVTYKRAGDTVRQGEWFGMIKFGSQVDVVIPEDSEVKVHLKQQVYAGRTILAVKKKL